MPQILNASKSLLKLAIVFSVVTIFLPEMSEARHSGYRGAYRHNGGYGHHYRRPAYRQNQAYYRRSAYRRGYYRPAYGPAYRRPYYRPYARPYYRPVYRPVYPRPYYRPCYRPVYHAPVYRPVYRPVVYQPVYRPVVYRTTTVYRGAAYGYGYGYRRPVYSRPRPVPYGRRY